MDPEIQKNMGAVRMYRQQQQNCMAKIQALTQTAKRVELTAKEITSVSFFLNNGLYFSLFKLKSGFWNPVQWVLSL